MPGSGLPDIFLLTESFYRLIVDLSGQLLNEGIYLAVGADDTLLAKDVSDACTDILTLFRSEKNSCTCAYNCATDKCV